jgi:hypothetical protein
MKVALPSLMATVVALGAWAPGVSGQLWEAAPVGEEYVSVALVGGVVSPGTTYADGSSLSSGTALGLRSTYWFKRYFGVGAGVTRSTNDADVGGATAGFSALVGQDPTVYLWGVHATLRYPMEMGVVSRMARSPWQSISVSVRSDEASDVPVRNTSKNMPCR